MIRNLRCRPEFHCGRRIVWVVAVVGLWLSAGCATRPLHVPWHPGPVSGYTVPAENWRHPWPLTSATSDEMMGSLAADGRRLVYVSNQKGNLDIYMVDLARGVPRRITDNVAEDYSPAWSPDGQRIAFISRRHDAKGDLFVYDIEEDKTTRLTGRETEDAHPAWLDNRSLLLSVREGQSPWKVVAVPDHRGTGAPAVIMENAMQATVSPDGKRMAFVRFGPDSTGHIWMSALAARRPAGKAVAVSPDGWNCGFPAFAAQGDTLVFSVFIDDTNLDNRHDAEDKPALASCRMTSVDDTCHAVQLTSTRYRGLFAQGFGSTLVYTGDLNGSLDIFVLPLGGQLAILQDAEEQMALVPREGDLADRVFALRRVADVAKTDDRKAGALLQVLSLQTETGSLLDAGITARRLNNLDVDPDSVNGVMIAAGTIRLDARRIHPDPALTPSAEVRGRLQDYVDDLMGLARNEALQAIGRGWAELYAAEIQIVLRDHSEALKRLQRLRTEFSDVPEIALAAEIAQVGVFAIFGDKAGQAEYLLGVMQRHGEDEVAQRNIAALILRTLKREPASRDEAALLRRLVDRHGDNRAFVARALFRIAALQEQLGSPAAAALTLGELAEIPQLPQSLAIPAQLELARLSSLAASARGGGQNIDDAITRRTLGYLEGLMKSFDRASRYGRQARREYVRLGLVAARRLETSKQWTQAYTLYRRMTANLDDERLLAYPYRRLIDIAWQENRIAGLEDDLRARLKEQPTNALYLYVNALIDSYRPDLEKQLPGILDKLDRSLAVDALIVQSHILRGWLMEQREFYLGQKRQGYLEEAIREYTTAHTLHDAGLSAKTEADLLLNLGNAYYLLNNQFGLAYNHYRRRLAIDEPFNNDQRELIFYMRLGRAALLSGRSGEAIPIIEQTLDIARADKNVRMQALLYDRLGLAYSITGDAAASSKMFGRGQAAHAEAGDSYPEAIVLRNLAINAARSHDIAQARKLFGQAVAAAAKQQLPPVPYDASLVGVGVMVPEIFPLGFGPLGENYLVAGFEASLADSIGDGAGVGRLLEDKRKALQAILAHGENASVSYRIGLVDTQSALQAWKAGDTAEARDWFVRARQRFTPPTEEDWTPLALRSALRTALSGVQMQLWQEGGDPAELAATVTGMEAWRVRIDTQAAAGVDCGAITRLRLLNTLGLLHIAAAEAMAAQRPESATPAGGIVRLDALGAHLASARTRFEDAIALLAVEELPALDDERITPLWRKRSELMLRLNIDALARKVGDEHLRHSNHGPLEALQKELEDRVSRVAGIQAEPDTGAVARADAWFAATPFDWDRPFDTGMMQMRDRVYRQAIARAAAAGDTETAWRMAEQFSEQQRRDALFASQPEFAVPAAAAAWNSYRDAHRQLLAHLRAMPDAAGEDPEAPQTPLKQWRARLSTLQEAVQTARYELRGSLHDDAAVVFGAPVGIDDARAFLGPRDVLLRYVAAAGSVFVIRVDAEHVDIFSLVRTRAQYLELLRGDAAVRKRLLADPVARRLKGAFDTAVVIPSYLQQTGDLTAEAFGVKAVAVNASGTLYVRHGRQRNFFTSPVVSVADPFGGDDAREGIFDVRGIIRLQGAVAVDNAAPADIRYTAPGAMARRWAAALGATVRSSLLAVDSLTMRGRSIDNALGGLSSFFAGLGLPAALWCSPAVPPQFRSAYFDAFTAALAVASPAMAAHSAAAALPAGQRNACVLLGYQGLDPAQLKTLAVQESGRLVALGGSLAKQGLHRQAVDAFERLLPAMDAAGMGDKKAMVYGALVTSYAAMGDPLRAIGYENKLLQSALDTKNLLEQVKARQILATLYTQAGRYDDALEHNGIVLDLFTSFKKDDLAAGTLNTRGLILEKAYRFAEAREAFIKALGLARKAGVLAVETAASRGVARVDYLYLGRYNEALSMLKSARKTLPADAPTAGWQLTIDAVRSQRSMGQYRKALAEITTLRDTIAQHIGTLQQAGKDAAALRPLEIQATLEAVYLYWYLSDYPRAITLAREARRLAESIGNRRYVLQSLNIVGLIYSSQGRYRQAKEVLGSALELAGRMNDKPEMATIYSNMGTAASQADTFVDALRYFKQAQSIDESLGSQVGLAFDHANLGLAYIRMGLGGQAEENARLALKYSTRIPSPTNDIKANITLGQVFLKKGDTAAAGKALSAALSTARRLSLREWEWQAALWQSRVLAAEGDTEAALAFARQSMSVIEAMPLSGTDRALRRPRRYTGRGVVQPTQVYDNLVTLLMKAGRDEEAFRIAQRARGRVIMDMLGGYPPVVKEADIPALQQRYIDIGIELSALQAERENQGGAAADELTLRQDALRAQRAEVLQRLGAINPRFPHLIRIADYGYDQVAARLKPRMALVMWYLGDSAAYRWIITADTHRVQELPVGAWRIAGDVGALVDRMQALAPVNAKCADITTLLLGDEPARLAADDIDSVVWSPYGALASLPVSLLRDAKGWLAQRFVLSVTPDVSMIMDGPGMSAVSPSIAGVGIGYSPVDSKTFPPLPFVHQELDRLHDALPDTRLLQGDAATIGALRAAVPGAGLLHIAAHTRFDAEQPFATAIALAPGGDSDGMLHLQDIFALPADKLQVVILAGCETRSPMDTGAGGMISLGTAFSYTGARAVIGSNSRVDDLASAVLMKHLHRALAAGESPARALQTAQQATRLWFAHPAYWAPFSVIGY